jgi:hypothetical protein
MRPIGRSLAASAGIAVAAIAIAGCGSSGPPSTPRRTIETFLRASAAGDAPTACVQLSAHATGEVMQGVSCEQGITLGASVYGPIIKQIQVSGVTTQGDSATGNSTLNGLPTATFKLRKQGGEWLIVDERRASSSIAGALAANSSGPSASRVETIAGCLDGAFGAVDNGGLDTTGGVAHVLLTVSSGGQSIAEVDVFASALAALSAYKAITAYERTLTTKLASTSVIVYLKTVPAGKRHTIEACG